MGCLFDWDCYGCCYNDVHDALVCDSILDLFKEGLSQKFLISSWHESYQGLQTQSVYSTNFEFIQLSLID